MAVTADTAPAPVSTFQNILPTNVPDCSLALKAGRKPPSALGINVPFPSEEHLSAAEPLPSLRGSSCQEVLPRVCLLFFSEVNCAAWVTRSNLKCSQYCLGFHSYGSLGEKKKSTTKHRSNHSICAEIQQKSNPPRQQQLKGVDGWKQARCASSSSTVVCLP